MPLRPLSFREVKRRLEAAGFVALSQRGSHVKFVKRDGDHTLTTIVPQHAEIAVGTLRSILRQANLSIEQFETL
jgi:predicted RNA binding protein YcfA (HicA-like mRNA interferase family)